MNSLSSKQLIASAKDFVHRALAAYLNKDTKVVLMFAAMSLEHLCKGYLCSLHPALLIETKTVQLDSVLHLVGLSAKAKDPNGSPRTLSGRESLARAKSILKSLKYSDEPIKRLHDVRDGVVHVGLLRDSETRETLTEYLKLADQLFTELKVEEDQRWGAHRAFVESLLIESHNKVRQEVVHRMAIAKASVSHLRGALDPPHVWNFVVARRRDRPWKPGFDAGTTDQCFTRCPACEQNMANLLGVIDHETDFDVEPDGEGGYESYVTGSSPMFHAERFFCGVCELTLDSAEQLIEAGLDTDFELDPEDYFHEPDEDLSRDR